MRDLQIRILSPASVLPFHTPPFCMDNSSPLLVSDPAICDPQPQRPALQRALVAADDLGAVLFETDALGRWTVLTPAWARMLGYGVQQSLGTLFMDYVVPEERARLRARLRPLRKQGQRYCHHQVRCVAKDGSVRWIEFRVRSNADQHDGSVGAFGSLTDVTQRQQTEERLRLAASVFEGTHESVIVTDPQAYIVDVNEAFVAHTGYTREQAIGRTPAMLASGRHDNDFYRSFYSSLQHNGCWSGEVWNRRADGELIAEAVRVRAVQASNGEHTHYVAIYSDITSLKCQQESLVRLAHFDSLTELPNRVLAMDRLSVLMADADRHGTQVAVCYLDLDGFKDINDHLGHAYGDALLVAASQRISHAVRASDTVGRLGGDEFVILLSSVAGGVSVDPVLERVLESLAQPFVLNGQPSRVTASVGVALYPDHGGTAEHLLRSADQAMCCAKRLGKNRVCMAGNDMDQPPAQEALLGELRQALAANQLCLHYQPKVCARTGAPLGAEALVRWQHPQRGLLAPGAFLPAVINTPVEVELDLWVVRRAVEQLARWRKAGRTLGLSINVSPGTLILPELADTVAGIVRDAGDSLDGTLGGIELEVIETAALDDLDIASRAIEACARQGIAFALDDFGTGYSSLNYLRRLPVSTLKIDRSFVSNMLSNQGDMHIVRAVIGLAQAFGVTTVAEGVETEEHARALTELGCCELQGYGIARPMTAKALEAWLDAVGAGHDTPSPPKTSNAGH